MVQGRMTAARWRAPLLVVVSAVVVPFLVTGSFRALPGATPFFMPFVLMLVAAVVIAVAAPARFRPVSIGIVLGSVLYAVLLLSITADMAGV